MGDTRIRSFVNQVGPIFCRTACLSAVFMSILGFYTLAQDQFELPKLAAVVIYAGLGLIIGSFCSIISISPILRFLPILAVAVAVSIPYSASPWASFLGDYENFAGFISWLIYGCLLVLSASIFQGQRATRLIFCIVTAATLSALYGLAQSQGIEFRNWDQSTIIKARTFGTMGNPNFQAALLAMSIPLGLVFSLWPNTSKPKLNHYFFRVWMGAGSILCLIALFHTKSRGGILGLAIGLGLLFFAMIRTKSRWSVPKIVSVATAVILLLTLFGRPITQRILTTAKNPQQNILRSRGHIWGPAIQMMRDKPILGHGLDTFKIIFPNYQGQEFAQIDGEWVSSRTAHNEPLQFAVSTGIVGLGAYVLMLFCILRFGFYTLGQSAQKTKIIAGAASALGAYWGQSLVSFGVAGTLAPAVLLVGTIVAAGPGEATLSKQKNNGRSGFFRWLIILGGLSLAVFWWQRLAADTYFAQARILTSRLDNNSKKELGSRTLAQALRGFDRACELMPREAKYFVYRGLAYEEGVAFGLANNNSHFIKQAENDYKMAVKLSGLNAYYYNNLGRIYEMGSFMGEEKFVAEAREKYRHAAFLGKNVSFFWANLGLFEEAQHQVRAANEALKEAGRLNPKLGADSYHRAATLNLERDNSNRAGRQVELGLRLQPGHDGLNRLKEKLES